MKNFFTNYFIYRQSSIHDIAKLGLLILGEKTASNCDFVKKNYKIENRNDLALNKNLKVYLHNNYQKNNQ